MPIRPYSLAVRLLHSGRYGRDADDPRLLSTFIGSRYFIRGHGLDGQRCRPTPERACGDELLGNRLMVANLELAVPVAGRGVATARVRTDPGGRLRLRGRGPGLVAPRRPAGGWRGTEHDQQHRGGCPRQCGRPAVRVRGRPRARRPGTGLDLRLRFPPRLLMAEPAAQLVAWFNERTPRPSGAYRATVPVETLARIFVEEGAIEGVTGDVAFAQSIVETGWFRFAGTVLADLDPLVVQRSARAQWIEIARRITRVSRSSGRYPAPGRRHSRARWC